ncbi:hypothetical protein [Pseudomonas wadenswilerensis]|uniref:Uncharacterized protein n=1 Tax=Pseudomonas wadenswilerensis TaxID=1785161 RepID=A0A380SWD2_9PSED|nr:hypothetical protein [Pseudomonas wadenswilerensis]SUQ61546.1 hypothetical protein CCOS864_00970 [Pseudomonas wadenswilerensis]
MSEKIYPLLNWLDISQAVDWLQGLTESAVTQYDLISLCAAKQCPVYVDLKQSVNGTDEETWWQDVSGRGIQEVKNPLALVDAGVLTDSRLVLLGEVTWTNDKGAFCREKIEWAASIVMIDVFPIFRPSDIQALAHKMNGATDQPTAAEIEGLRDQLKKACEAKENAWYLTDKYRVELETLRETAEQDRSSREAAWLRAEQAEKLAEELADRLDRMEAKADHCQDALASSNTAVAELKSTVEHEQMARKYAESLAKELRDELEDEYQARMAERTEHAKSSICACEQGEAVSPASEGITFPYATKQLEAMRDAALAHWADHDRSKPAPYGIQKTVASFLADRTGQNSRKLAELAVAIKPDDLPKA